MFTACRNVFCLLLIAGILHLGAPTCVQASAKEERIQQLKEKLQKLQELLQQTKEEQLRQQPPTEIPWQPIQQLGEERPAYAQYVYLLAPNMTIDELDNVLQQVNFFASQDELKERGALFVIPSHPLASRSLMDVGDYSRDMATELLRKAGVPAAIEGALLVSPAPLGQAGVAAGPLLLVDLAGCNQILRARIFELLKSERLFTEDGSIHAYLWRLLQAAAPQAFTVAMDGAHLWLAVAKD